MAAAQAAESHGDEWGLTWYFLCGIYTSIPTWTDSQNSLAAAEAPSLKICSHKQEMNIETYLRKKKLKKENVEKTDIIICQKKETKAKRISKKLS